MTHEESHGGATAEARVQCTARSKQSGQRCRQRPVPGHRVCHYHGARAGTPIKHGRYSQVAGRFAKAIEESRLDATLLDLREPISILDAMVKGALERASAGDSPELRKKALSLVLAARAAHRDDAQITLTEKLDALEQMLREGIAEDRNTRVLVDRTDRLRRAVEGAWQVKLARKNVMNVRDLVALLARVVDLLRRELPPKDAARVARLIDAEIMGGAGRAALPQAEPSQEQTVEAGA